MNEVYRSRAMPNLIIGLPPGTYEFHVSYDRLDVWDCGDNPIGEDWVRLGVNGGHRFAVYGTSKEDLTVFELP